MELVVKIGNGYFRKNPPNRKKASKRKTIPMIKKSCLPSKTNKLAVLGTGVFC
jgi:hypothetical protein